MQYRPRLSPKSPGEMNRADYFHSAACSATGRAGAIKSASSTTTTATAASTLPPAAAAAQSTTPIKHQDQQKQQRPMGHAAATAATGMTAGAVPFSSPSSNAFTANFDSLMRDSTTTAHVPQTPIHAPASSPFFPGASMSGNAATGSIRGESAARPLGGGNGATAMQGVEQQQGMNVSTTPPAAASSLPAFKLPAMPTSRRANPSGSIPVQSNRYIPVSPQELVLSLTQNAADLLILDIRTHTAFLDARLAGSINVSVPSIQLRRPAFGVDRVQESLTPSEQARFARWQTCSRIVVLDQESNALAEGSGPASLLAKFEKAGFKGELCWVKGGWTAVRNGIETLVHGKEEMARLIESGERIEEDDDQEVEGTSATASNGSSSLQGLNGGHRSPPKPLLHLATDANGADSTPESPGLTGIPGSKKHARHAGPGSSGGQSPAQETTAASFSRANRPTFGSSTSGGVRPVLNGRDLPASAFQLASTTAYRKAGDVGKPAQAPGPGTFSSRTQAGGTGLGGKRHKPTFDHTSLMSSHASAFSRSPNPTFGGGSGGEAAPAMPGQLGGLESDRGKEAGDEASAGWQSTSSSGAASRSANAQTRASANPFFDNIRQNTEALSLERSLANLNPVNLPPVPSNYLAALPPYLRSLVSLSPMSRADRLARQFYELEAAEKERLEGTFRWHSRYPGGRQEAIQEWREAAKERERSEGDSREVHGEIGDEKKQVEEEAEKWERFGISAGVELGNLNRFRNIFPYEHTRVHLKEHSPHATDYVNASHLALRTSSKRFIASQGPLPATFRDFWQMCDQEHVGVIVMLTNLQEGGRDKCGRYWVETHEGEWDVHVEGDSAHDAEARAAFVPATPAARPDPLAGGGFFSAFDAAKTAPPAKEAIATDTTIRRTITVQRKRGSGQKRPRKIRHIQYRAWPDFDIPADPTDVVSLVDEVDAAQREYMREIGWNVDEHDGQEPPILAHCSAGVGRTGVFIMVSSLLEKFRSDLARSRAEQGPARMDIDGDEQKRPPSRPVLEERVSDGVASSLAAGLSDSSLDERKRASEALKGEQPKLPSVDEPALKQEEPAFAGVNELREQRMSMVANYRQYVCVLECVLEGALRSLKGNNSV